MPFQMLRGGEADTNAPGSRGTSTRGCASAVGDRLSGGDVGHRALLLLQVLTPGFLIGRLHHPH